MTILNTLLKVIGITIISTYIILEPRKNTQTKKQTETPKSQTPGNEE